MESTTQWPGVVVASEQILVAETVRVGLVSRGLQVVTLRWPGERRVETLEVLPRARAHVGLLITGLECWPRLRAASLLIEETPLPWIVLTGAPYGPFWGAALEMGAGVVLPRSAGLDQVCEVIVGVARGAIRTAHAEREMLISLWTDLLERRERISQRVGSLTPREHEVLVMLHAGEQVAGIAQLLGVSPATVRSQVKTVLRKLGVHSQLGAVAALDYLLELEPMERFGAKV